MGLTRFIQCKCVFCACVSTVRLYLLSSVVLVWVFALFLLLQVDVTKCVVNSDPSFRSHWLVSAVCAFGHYVKATVLYLLREKWNRVTQWILSSTVHRRHSTKASTALDYVYTRLHWAFVDEHTSLHRKTEFCASSARLSIYCYITAHVWCGSVKNHSQLLFLALSFSHKQQNSTICCLFSGGLAAPTGGNR